MTYKAIETMFIANRTHVIKDTEEYPIAKGMIEELDSMLTEYGVQHFFSLPVDATDGVANNDEDCLNVFYDDEDEVMFFLVYALWAKSVRGLSDEGVKKAMRSIANK